MATKKNGTSASAASPFDALASAPKASTSKSTVEVAAKVDDKVKGAVDVIIKAKAAIAAAEREQGEAETLVIGHVRPQQDDLARSGQFTKSLIVEGNTGNLTYTTVDKFSVPQDADTQAALKTLLGNKYDDFFQKVRTISLTPAVQENQELINKIVKAVTDAGITLGEAFEVKDVIKATKDLDRRQYDLGKKLDEFRSLVRQNKPGLK
jgi:hypothetical protein